MTDPEVREVAADARTSLMRAAEGRTRAASMGSADAAGGSARPRAGSYPNVLNIASGPEVFEGVCELIISYWLITSRALHIAVVNDNQGFRSSETGIVSQGPPGLGEREFSFHSQLCIQNDGLRYSILHC